MKISTKALKAYNAGVESRFNDNWNKANGAPSMIEYSFLEYVRSYVFGCLGKPRKITQKDIKYCVAYNVPYVPHPYLVKLYGAVK